MLVVGSQCEPMGLELSMLPGAAHDLGAVLTSELGRCSPALPAGPVLVDPSARQLDDALVEAMRAAHDQRATLVLAFIGHGGFEDADFYLMAKDSTVPDSREAVLVGQRIKELLRRYSALDGLVLLIDACHPGLAVESAGREWLQTMRRGRRRLELPTATDEGPAYGACATRTLTRLILTGSPQLGERLHFTEVKGYLDQHCGSQVAIHMAYDGSREVLISAQPPGSPSTRPGVRRRWPAPPSRPRSSSSPPSTRQRRRSPHCGTSSLRTRNAWCWRDPPGSGKSAAVAGLAHPHNAATVHAVLFTSGTETVEQLALELARQLRGQSPSHAFAGEFPAQDTSHADGMSLPAICSRLVACWSRLSMHLLHRGPWRAPCTPFYVARRQPPLSQPVSLPAEPSFLRQQPCNTRWTASAPAWIGTLRLRAAA
ncbi:hypothetical protein BBK82_07440 [Lentzea guizhouensis]|uniref:Peptidase C14 caspase domain-containing protein n=1 Tax=Lentzea guizhouensis TaxID=1586287 RepID=A0A1B2HE10_9PSEU|nr:hypothetical protein BBK82_07440 [Lentzea guizhouensis]